MKFGTLERQALKSQAKTLLMKNLRFCMIAAGGLVLISLLVHLLQALFSSSIPDFLGLHGPASFAALYERLLREPLVLGQALLDYSLQHFLHEQLAVILGVLLEAPLLLAFMAGLYRIGVYDESPAPRSLGQWYCRIGLSARSVTLLFFLDVIFEVLRTVLVLGPIALMLYITIQALAAGAVLLPFWVLLLPLLSLGGLVLGAFLYARWLPALHFMAKYPHLGPWGALRKSAQELKGHRWQYILLILSFLPWLLLEAVTYGIAGLYVLPYLELTVTLFLEKIRLPQDPPPEVLPQ